MAEELSTAIPDRLERKLHALLDRAVELDVTLATAESCTGGLVASLLTDVEGAGRAFERGFVVYSVAAKCELLGLAREQIEDCGAVSKPVALAMAEGAIANSNADAAVAITGFAGPGGPDDEPGLVHLACRRRGGGIAHREEHFGDIGRGPVRLAAAEVAIDMLARALSEPS